LNPGVEPDGNPRGYPVGAVCCLVHDRSRGSLLYVKKLPHKYDGDRWGCLGGKQEFGESTSEAAWRELGEEGGPGLSRRTLIHYGLIGVVEDVIEPIGKHYLCMIHLFLVRENCNVVAVNNEPENHADVAWFPADSPPSPVTGAFESISSALLCGGHLATVPADVRAAMWRASIQE
jgi:8-oxo-dGTP pyrophosphatase MutT (NUDIX family)